MRGRTLASAINTALHDAMREDEKVVVYGADVGRLGGVFRVTAGLADSFGEKRCFDTPVAEAGIVGTAIGMAMYGYRPVVEMQFDAFAYPAFEQLISHVAKMRSRTRGQIGLPIVVRVPYGGGIGGVEHHSDASEAYYAHTPGLQVAVPSTAADAYTLLRAAIRSADPVIFLEPKRLYWSHDDEFAGESEPFGRATVRRHGTSATLIAYGPTVRTALRAAELAVSRGWNVQVLDLRTLVPYDEQTVTASVRRTGRAVIVHESQGFCGVGAEIAAQLAEHCFADLKAPVLRVTGYDVPYPPPRFEHTYLPTADRILEALSVVHRTPPRAAHQPTRGFVNRSYTDSSGRRRQFTLPDLGEGLVEAQVVRWLVKPGDSVTVDEPVVEVETAKASLELPTPYAGHVAELHAEVGQVVSVGSLLLTVVEPGSSNAAAGRNGEETPTRSAHKESTSTRSVPLTGARGAIAAKLQASHREVPAVTVWMAVNATALVETRRRLAASTGLREVGFLPLLACYAAHGLRRYPALNARVDQRRNEIVQLSDVHLSLVAQTSHGLVVPVVAEAHKYTVHELVEEVDRVVRAAKAGSFAPAGSVVGTFSVNNFGALGVDGSTPIVNHPEAGMLGMGRLVDRPWIVDGNLTSQKVTTLTLTFDHRVCDGDVASGFLRHVAHLVESGGLL